MYKSYQEFYNNFRWEIPSKFNIAHYICERYADTDRVALIYEDEQGSVTNYTFKDLNRQANRLANYFKKLNINFGDRIGILLSQQPETVISHLAGYKIGTINIPLFTLFGTEALQFRLQHSETKIIIVEQDNLHKIRDIQDSLPNLEHIICLGDVQDIPQDIIPFYSALEASPDDEVSTSTSADDPALIIYTSGTTGPPKGALHAHRVLIGHLPGIQASHNFFPQENDLFWTPADWAWIGGLLDVVFPSLYYAVPVLACRFQKFTAQKALELMKRHRVRNVFLPPTALKLMRNDLSLEEFQDLSLRTVASGGEPMGEEILDWGYKAFGLTINEFYGQTEANLFVSNCSQIMPSKPNSMGRPVPGHQASILNEQGIPVSEGEMGEISIKSGDPVMFLGYWKNEQATQEKFVNDWLTTGDMGVMDEEGYFYFKGRKDDVISCAGYRIGPSEVEDCLLKHPTVYLSAVIGKPDPLRGEIVKAFIQLKKGHTPNQELEQKIKDFVKKRLAAHEYPREIEFIEEIPLTVTGKVKRNDLRQRES